MTNEEFKSWLNGYLTLSSDQFLTLKQFKIIKNHANLVVAIFNELDPDIDKFLSHLDSMLKNKNLISFDQFQKLACSACLVIDNNLPSI